MVYISDGNVGTKRSPWRFSIVGDIFWLILNFIGTSSLFFRLCVFARS
jgi:hypothetical protein